MKKYLVVVDMQNDFITGSLGTHEACLIVPKVVEKIKNFEGDVYTTSDTHRENYLDTFEGKKLPVPHCINGTWGQEIDFLVRGALREKSFNGGICHAFLKDTFGCPSLASYMKYDVGEDPDVSIELCGLCTDICVISNALILRSEFPNAKISVDSSCCAGVTPEKHEAALEVMRSCQIDVY